MNQDNSTSSTSSPIDGDAVSRRAYELWEKEGRPEGCDVRHWLEAEQEYRDRESNSATGRENSTVATSASPGSDVRPLQGTRSAAAAGRAPKRGSNAPFSNDRNAIGNGPTQIAAKRRPPSTPAL